MNEEHEKQTDVFVNNHFLFHSKLLTLVAMMEALGSWDSNDEHVSSMEGVIESLREEIHKFPEFYKEYAKYAQGGTD